MKKSKFDLEKNQIIDKMWEEYEITPNMLPEQEPIKNPASVQKEVNNLRNEMDAVVLDDSNFGTYLDNYSLAQRIERLIHMGDDRNVIARFVMGEKAQAFSFCIS